MEELILSSKSVNYWGKKGWGSENTGRGINELNLLISSSYIPRHKILLFYLRKIYF